MDINELLDEVKVKLGITTDYQLYKALDISQQDIGKYRKGTLMPDAYACFRFAETLGKAPAVVIAQVQAKKQRKEHKRLYFERFFSIAGLWIILGIVSAIYSPTSEAGQTAGNRVDSTYTVIMRSVKKRLWNGCVAIFVRYFTCNWTRKVPAGLRTA